MREVSRDWQDWKITASRFDSGGELWLRAERGERTIHFSRQYNRVLGHDREWRDPTQEEAEIIASPATSEAISELIASENAEREVKLQAWLHTPAGPSCIRHPDRPAEHYSQCGELICAECYARE
jgi:hypothetical protein